MEITDNKRALWRRMTELAKPAHLDGEPIIALLDENKALTERVADLGAIESDFQTMEQRASAEVAEGITREIALKKRVAELEGIVDVHYKSLTYYYGLLVGISKALGRDEVDGEQPIGGMADAVEIYLTHLSER